MKGHPRVIGYLQRAVSHEFGAAQQFTLQAVQSEGLGLDALATELRQGAREELGHAEMFLRQMRALGVTPHPGQARVPPVGRSQAELLRFGLATEADAIRLYREASLFCGRIGDADNQAVFARILADEEHHYRELERRLAAIGAARA